MEMELQINQTGINENEIAEAFVTLSTLQNLTSTKEKDALLIAHKGNRVLKTLFYYTWNQFKQYYIKQLPQTAPATKPIDATNYHNLIALLEKLAARAITGVQIAHEVDVLFARCNETEQLWYRRVFARSLEIGMAEKAINKVYGNYIPVYDVLLADRIKDVTLTDPKAIRSLPERFVIQYKIDGYRMTVHTENSGILLKTRSGLLLSGYDALETEATQFLPKGYVYDGEMVSPKLSQWIEQNMLCDRGEKIADRSLFKESVSKAFAKKENKTGIFNIFDMIKEDEWRAQQGAQSYQDRNNMLNSMVSPIVEREDVSQMAVVPTSRVFYRDNPEDLKEVVRIFHKFLNWGWEGLMIKAVDAPYAWKRSKQILKLKLMDTVDLRVLSVVEAAGQAAGTIGTLVCDYQGTTLNIGTGKLTMDEKRKFWECPYEIVGKTIEVAYQAESIGKNGEPVLDFANCRKIRTDK